MSDNEQFKRFAAPLVRRIYPQLIPSQIVSEVSLELEKEIPKPKKYRSIDDDWLSDNMEVNE